MKSLINYIFLTLFTIALSQDETQIFKVNYEQFDNGVKRDTGHYIVYQNQIVSLSESDEKIQQYVDLKNKENISTIMQDEKLFKNVVLFDTMPIPSFEDRTEIILGYNCKYASYLYFSNTIEVWYTDETIAKGSPYSLFLPDINALVLKIVINNNRQSVVSSIEIIDDYPLPTYISNEAQETTKAEFEEIKINSRFTRLPIFTDEIINFDNSLKPPEDETLVENVTYHFSKGSVILKKISLSQDLMDSGHVYAKLNCQSNGDAYDRTGSVFIIPDSEEVSLLDAYQHGLEQIPVYIDNLDNKYQGIKREINYEPPVEILRFFTSFGVNHFNEERKINNYEWEDDIIYKHDVSSLMPSDDPDIWIGVFIGNYDGGGHRVSLELNFYPSFDESESDKSNKYIQSLFSTINTLEMSGQNYGKLFNNDTLAVDFEIPENVEELQLLFTSTGHGGWGGGDEFNPRLNQIFIDGKEIFKIVPWRTDCATYRLSNPASGNFSNGLSSSDFSRSNWCPGTLTSPFVVPLTELQSGKHTIEVIIDQGEDEGGSFNHWGVSGILTGKISN